MPSPDNRIEPPSLPPATTMEARIARIERDQIHDRAMAAALTARVAKLEIETKPMRARLKSLPAEVHADAEDTARHEILKLREQLEKEKQATRIAELEAERQTLLKSNADVERLAESRRKRIWSVVRWALGIIGPPVGLLLEHFLHVLPH